MSKNQVYDKLVESLSKFEEFAKAAHPFYKLFMINAKNKEAKTYVLTKLIDANSKEIISNPIPLYRPEIGFAFTSLSDNLEFYVSGKYLFTVTSDLLLAKIALYMLDKESPSKMDKTVEELEKDFKEEFESKYQNMSLKEFTYFVDNEFKAFINVENGALMRFVKGILDNLYHSSNINFTLCGLVRKAEEDTEKIMKKERLEPDREEEKFLENLEKRVLEAVDPDNIIHNNTPITELFKIAIAFVKDMEEKNVYTKFQTAYIEYSDLKIRMVDKLIQSEGLTKKKATNMIKGYEKRLKEAGEKLFKKIHTIKKPTKTKKTPEAIKKEKEYMESLQNEFDMNSKALVDKVREVMNNEEDVKICSNFLEINNVRISFFAFYEKMKKSDKSPMKILFERAALAAIYFKMKETGMDFRVLSKGAKSHISNTKLGNTQQNLDAYFLSNTRVIKNTLPSWKSDSEIVFLKKIDSALDKENASDLIKAIIEEHIAYEYLEDIRKKLYGLQKILDTRANKEILVNSKLSEGIQKLSEYLNSLYTKIFESTIIENYQEEDLEEFPETVGVLGVVSKSGVRLSPELETVFNSGYFARQERKTIERIEK